MNNKLITKSIKLLSKMFIQLFAPEKKSLTTEQKVIARHLKELNERFVKRKL